MKGLLLVALIIVGLISCKKEYSVNFSTSQSSYYIDQSVAFNVQGASNLSLNWDFGDGTTASGDTVSHAYSSPGVYSVKLTVNGSTASIKKLTIYNGTSSYQIENLTGVSQNIISFSTDAEGHTTHEVKIGNIASGSKSNMVFTYDSDIYAAPTPAENTFFYATPARMVKFSNTVIDMSSATETIGFEPDNFIKVSTQSVKLSTTYKSNIIPEWLKNTAQ